MSDVKNCYGLPAQDGLIMPRATLLLLTLLLPASFVAAAEADAPLTFEKHIRPIFKEKCFHCHGEDEEIRGSLDLRLRRFLVQGGYSGAAIVPGNSQESYLLQRMRDGEMPPPEAGQPVPKEQLDLIARWIDAGAPTERPEPEKLAPGMLITEEDRNFWSFQPVRRPEVPVVKQQDLVENPVDAFILRKLEANGLSFSPPADRRTLIRRAYFDLVGLPPSPEDVERFEQDDSPEAWSQLIDRLLDSPRYGERWGQHWLDVAGYTDSEGVTNADTERKWAWKYRDYVIRSFNANKPFDQFVREQLAGDEMVQPPYKNLSPEDIEKLTATGFLRTAPDGTASKAVEAGVARNQVIGDTVEIVTSSLLGMTVKCAQCHEHRYDPIPQADYYRIRAIFEPALDWKKWRTPSQRLISLYTDADRQQAAALEQEAKEVLAERSKKQSEFIEKVFQEELAKVPETEREAAKNARETPAKKRTAEQKKLLRKYPSLNVSAGSLYLYDRKAADELKAMAEKAAEIRAKKPKEEFIRALTEVPGGIPETFLFDRGDFEQPKESVEPAGLTILEEVTGDAAIPKDNPDLPTTGRRLEYARYLTSGKHPLVARVFVNRVWMHHFGQGLVPTAGDFGRLGTPPTHPKLLDWLAAEFVRSGWDVKQLHRLLMKSATYQQALRTESAHQEIDPDNNLYGGARLKRLEAEVLRDAILAVSGKINDKPFGPPIPVMADRVGQWVIGIENLNAGRPGPVIPMHGKEFRRSIYVQVRRSRPLAVLDTFDRPKMEPNCEQRTSSTVATQSLMLMNGKFVLSQSLHMADRLVAEVGDDSAAQVRRAWNLVFSRKPTPSELEDAQAFLTAQTEDLKARAGKKDDPARQALASLCQVLFSSNEFLYVD